MTDEKSPAPAVTRAAAIMTVLAEGGPSGLTEIARTLDLAKSSTLNLLIALEQSDLVRRGPEGYSLGRRTVELGGAYVRGFDLVREFYRVCASDASLQNELCQIAALHGDSVLYLARHEGRAPLRLSASIGDRFPASITAVGNILLAQLSDDEVRELYPDRASLPIWTDRSVASVGALLDKLAATRERGYSIDDRETNPGVYGMALLIPGRRPGDEALALGVSMMEAMATEKARQATLDHLREARSHLASPQHIFARTAEGTPIPPGV